MKSLSEIQKLSFKAIENQKQQKIKNSINLILRKKKIRKINLQYTKELATVTYPEWIEEAAKNGKKEFNIDISTCGFKGLSSKERLTIKYIKKYLKDFNPVFKEFTRTGTIYDYEGSAIGERFYDVVNVKFSW